MKFRPRLSYANVVSSLCLFLLLGGVAYAASALPKNSVGTKQLRKNAVTGAKVKNHSLSLADFKNGQIPAGAQGPEGKQGTEGKQGPIGPSDLYSVTGAFKSLATGEAKYALASLTLPAGQYQVIASQTAQPSGGGAELDCYIYAGAGQQASFYTKLPAGADAVVTGIATLVLTESTVVSDRCTAFENTVIVPEPKLVALKVGAVH